MHLVRRIRVLLLLVPLGASGVDGAESGPRAADGTVAAIEALATKTGATIGKPPAWARGAFVYRISTPDEAKLLPTLEAGLAATANLLDGSVRQVVIANGLIGHDHGVHHLTTTDRGIEITHDQLLWWSARLGA